MSQPPDFAQLWSQGLPYDVFVEQAGTNTGLWRGVYQTTAIPEWAIEAVRDRLGRVRLLVIAEDWCGDASNTVPVLARLGDEADGLDLRIIRRDDHPEVMNAYLTNGSRSIPIVIALDGDFRELGHWGPRPRELQQWVMEHRDRMPAPERYRETRRWYARDRGESTLREFVGVVRGAEAPTA